MGQFGKLGILMLEVKVWLIKDAIKTPCPVTGVWKKSQRKWVSAPEHPGTKASESSIKFAMQARVR
jgi:hypothetical protein